MTVAALVVLLAALATGAVARTAAAARPPLVAHVPGQPIWVRQEPPFPFTVWLVAAGITTVLTVAAILAAPAFQLAAAIFGLGILGLITAIFRRYASGCAEVEDAVEAYAPRIAIPCASGDTRLERWAPWVDRTGVPWVVVAATPEVFAELVGRHDGPIVTGAIPATVTGVVHVDGRATQAYDDGSPATHVGVAGDPRQDAKIAQRFMAQVVELAAPRPA